MPEADARAPMSAALVAGLVAGYGIAVPLGAVGTYLMSLTARTSWRVGALAALGVATADGLYALLAVAGGSALTPLIGPVLHPLRYVSAVVLAVLAARTAVTTLRGSRTLEAARAESTAVRAYFGLLGITLLNPATVIYFAAIVLGSPATAADPVQRSVFVLAAFTASASWQLLLAGSGLLLGRLLTGSRGRLATGLASSAVIAALALHLAAG